MTAQDDENHYEQEGNRATTERLSRYRAESEPAQDHDAGPDQPDEEIAQARASISSARAALAHPLVGAVCSWQLP